MTRFFLEVLGWTTWVFALGGLIALGPILSAHALTGFALAASAGAVLGIAAHAWQ